MEDHKGDGHKGGEGQESKARPKNGIRVQQGGVRTLPPTDIRMQEEIPKHESDAIRVAQEVRTARHAQYTTSEIQKGCRHLCW